MQLLKTYLALRERLARSIALFSFSLIYATVYVDFETAWRVYAEVIQFPYVAQFFFMELQAMAWLHCIVYILQHVHSYKILNTFVKDKLRVH